MAPRETWQIRATRVRGLQNQKCEKFWTLPAILNRLVHNAYQLNLKGDSMRKKKES